MKILAALFTFFIIAFGFTSCQKELTAEDVPAAGFLVKDSTGNCAPISVGGTYTINNLLTNVNYIEVQVNFDQPGAYAISSDTLNGYYFHGTGTAGNAGLKIIRLQAVGTPVAIGNNSFTVTCGISTCNVNILVTNSTAALFVIGNPAGDCTGSIVAGTYAINSPLNQLNTITVQVNVSRIGPYSISTNIVNGMSFSKTGIFTTTGLQSVTLTGNGIPTFAGANNLSVNGIPGCTIIVTVGALTSGVFIAGEIGGKAVLWKDNVPMFLSTFPDCTSSATDVTVVGNDIYVLGEEIDSLTHDFRIIIWKNGLRSSVSINSFEECSRPRNLMIQNTDVYFTYSQYVNGPWTHVVLNKNGVNTLLNHGVYQGANAVSLKMYQNDVYVCAAADSIWNENGTTNFISKAVYWKNGQYFPLPYDRGEFYDADFDNAGNLFFVGSARLRINPANAFIYYDIASLFKNGNYNLFHGWSNNFIGSYGASTFVDNSTADIYTGGIFHESSAPNSQGIQNLVYWKGSNMVKLTNYDPSLNIGNAMTFIDLYVKNSKVYSLVYDDRNPSKYFYYVDNLQVNVQGVANPNNVRLNKIFVK